MIESERSRSWRPRLLNKLVIEDELMDRSVVLTLNRYMLLSVTPERPATSMAIKLATVRMNGRATQNILPMLPILVFASKSVSVYLVVVIKDVWYDVDAVGWSGGRTRLLRMDHSDVGPWLGDVWEINTNDGIPNLLRDCPRGGEREYEREESRCQA